MNNVSMGIFFILISMLFTIRAPVAETLMGKLSPNQIIENNLKVGYVDVPLPPGQWHVVSINEAGNNNFQVIASIVLWGFVDGKPTMGISLKTNLDLASTGWSNHPLCSRKDIYFIQAEANYHNDQRCWGVNHTVYARTSNARPTMGTEVRQWLRERGFEMPNLMTSVLFHLADRTKFLTYEVAFDPVAYGFQAEPGGTIWANASWHRDVVGHDPNKKGFLDKLVAQGKDLYPMLRRNFR